MANGDEPILPMEIFNAIAEFIDDGKTWKMWRLANSAFSRMWPDKILKLSNPVWSMIMKYPDRPWSGSKVSRNPWTRTAHLLRYPEFPWHWSIVVMHVPLTFEFLDDIYATQDPKKKPIHDGIFNRVGKLSLNKTLPFEFVKKYPKLKWDWDNLSMIISVKDILENLDLPWQFKSLSWNITLSAAMVEKTMSQYNWAFSGLCLNTTITPTLYSMMVAENHFNTDEYHVLSANPAITAKFIEKNPSAHWNYSELVHVPKAIEMFRQNPTAPWKYSCLSHHPELTIADIVAHPNAAWDMFKASSFVRPKESGKLLSEVDAVPFLKWHYFGLLGNANITDKEQIELIDRFVFFDNGYIAYKPACSATKLAHIASMEIDDRHYLKGSDTHITSVYALRYYAKLEHLRQHIPSTFSDNRLYESQNQWLRWTEFEDYDDWDTDGLLDNKFELYYPKKQLVFVPFISDELIERFLKHQALENEI